MAYQVGTAMSFENKPLSIGTYEATIELASIKDNNFPVTNEEMIALGFTKTQQIGMLIKSDIGEQGWVNINQFLNKTTFELEFSQGMMNTYSQAIGIPVGTNFLSIQEWVDFIKGKRILITVIEGTNGKPKISKVEPVIIGEGLAVLMFEVYNNGALGIHRKW